MNLVSFNVHHHFNVMSVEHLADLMIRPLCFHLVFDQSSDDDQCDLLVYDVSHGVGQIMWPLSGASWLLIKCLSIIKCCPYILSLLKREDSL